MPITLHDQVVELSGHISIDDAEPLYQWLLANPTGVVVLRQLEHVHTAIWQLLCLFSPQLDIQGGLEPMFQNLLLPAMKAKEPTDENYPHC